MKSILAEGKLKFYIPLIGISLRILVFISLVAGTALVFRPLQLVLLERMENTRDNLIAQGEDFLGRKIRYGSMGPSIFGVLDIRDVLILREDDSVFLSISRLRLSYSFWELFRGNFSGAFHTVRLDRPVLSLDFTRDSDLRERFSPLNGQINREQLNGRLDGQNGPVNIAALFPDEFSLRIHNGEWEFSGWAGLIRFHGIRFDAALRQNRLSFQGRWDIAGLLAGPFDNFSAEMSSRINGVFFLDLGEGSASFSIPHLAGDSFRFMPLSFGFFLSANQLEIRKAQDTYPFALSLVYNFENPGFRGRFIGEDFALEDFIVISGGGANLSSLLAVRISGNADFEWDNSGVLSYNADLQGRGAPVSASSALSASSASIDIIASGDREELKVQTLDIFSPYGDIIFRGGINFYPNDPDRIPIAPYGNLSISNFRRYGSQGISGDFIFDTQGREISLKSNNINAQGTGFAELDTSIYYYFEDQYLGFMIFIQDNLGPDADTGPLENPSSIYLSGFWEPASREARGSPSENNLQMNLRLNSVYLTDIFSYFGALADFPALPPLLSPITRETTISTEVFFDTDFSQILYNVTSFAIYSGEDQIIGASLSGTNRRLDLSEARIWLETGWVEISGSIDMADVNDISLYMNTLYGDFSYQLNAIILDRRQLSIMGTHDLQAHFFYGANDTVTGFIHGDSIPFPSGGRSAFLSLDLSLLYYSPSNWDMNIAKFEILGLSTPGSSQSSLSFSGSAGETGLYIQDFFYDDGLGALGGYIILDWDYTYSYCGYRVSMNGIARNEIYELSGIYYDNLLELTLFGSGMQLSRFSSYNAVMNGSFDIYWESFSSFNAEADISSFVLFPNQSGEIIQASVRALMDSDLLELRDLRINYPGLDLLVPLIGINRYAERAETEVRLSGNVADLLPVNLSFQGEARFGSSETWLDLFQDFGFLEGALIVDTAFYGDMISREPFSFSFLLENQEEGIAVNLNGGPRNMLRFRYSPEQVGGIFSAALSAPFPVRGFASGYVDARNIDAQLSDLYVDMSSLWSFIPPLGMPIIAPDGIVTGSVRVAGTLEEPEFYGSLRATSLQLIVPEFLSEPIMPVPTTILLDGYEMTFGPVDAVVGPGAGQGQGWFMFNQWIPSTFIIDLQVPQETPIPCDFSLGVIVQGFTSGRMIIAMEDMVLSLTGNLIAHNTALSISGDIGQFDNLFVSEPGKVSTITDMTILAGRRVEFFWPSFDFPILQANADMGTGVNIRYDNSSGSFSLTGDVHLRSGELFYLERNFYIREGTIFFRESETSMDPHISARAEMRDHNQDGPVIISLLIDYQPLLSFTPRFVSNPPLSQHDIFALLGQIPPEGDDRSQRNLAAGVVLDTLAQYIFINRLQREVRDFLGLDMLSIRTQIAQNFVLQQQQGTRTQTDNIPDERPNRVGNYFDNTTVFIGKYFGADMFGEAMLLFRYDENQEDYGGMRLEPQIGLEMRNPFFDIRFDVAPMHRENWFIDDISFSLIWRRTF